MNSVTLNGKDNRGNPRQVYADRIAAMDDAAFVREAEQKVWLSAYATNNPRSDYHWQVDACSDEAARRNKPQLFAQAHEQACASIR